MSAIWDSPEKIHLKKSKLALASADAFDLFPLLGYRPRKSRFRCWESLLCVASSSDSDTILWSDKHFRLEFWIFSNEIWRTKKKNLTWVSERPSRRASNVLCSPTKYGWEQNVVSRASSCHLANAVLLRFGLSKSSALGKSKIFSNPFESVSKFFIFKSIKPIQSFSVRPKVRIAYRGLGNSSQLNSNLANNGRGRLINSGTCGLCTWLLT